MSVFLKSLMSISLLAVPAWATAGTEPDPVSTQGMELIEKDRRGEIYADPGVDWSVYDKIVLDEATVAFRRNWQRDQNFKSGLRVSTNDMERIKSDLATLFDEVFVEELSQQGGFQIVDGAGADVMRIVPRIVDLDVYAPDTNWSGGMNRTYVESSGRMTLKLEIHDSETGDLIAVASDRRESPRRGYAQWATSVSNKADARRMLQKWAEGLRTRLEEATASGKLQ